MAVTAKVYGLALQSILNAELDFDTDTIKAMLCGSLYVPDQDGHRYKSSVTNELATGSGYTQRGVTLTGKTVTYDAASNTLVLDCDDPTWTGTIGPARIIVFYKDTGVDATSPLLAWADFGADVASAGDQFKYTVPTVSGGNGGIAKFAAA